MTTRRACNECDEPNLQQLTGGDDCAACKRGTQTLWQCGRCGAVQHRRFRLKQPQP